LRMGPIFSSRGSNALTHLLDQMKRGNALSPTSHSRGSPVYAEDAARVVAALCDQLSTQAAVWGIYHYCSDDVINCYDFTESLLAATSGFIPVDNDAVVLNKSSETESPLYTALDCTKIRNTFAIHQMPWRNYIAESVAHYFEAR
jgi:dTDP-4-dehydrorhamnose reductase